jgi:hypothetical protein
LETAGEARNRGQEGFDQPAARNSIAALGRDDQVPFIPRSQSLLKQWESSGPLRE